MRGLRGESGSVVRSDPQTGGLVVSVAVPVQRYKQVLGAVMLSSGNGEIEEELRTVRLELLRIFGVALLVTILLSLYLAGTIARPIRRLAAAAERARGRGARVEIPDFAGRGDGAPQLTLDIAGHQGDLIVPGIESRLSQVFINVIANAVSFSPPDGEIRIHAGRDGRAVLVSVEDHGPGIPEDKLTAIFDRFYSERPAGEKFGTHSGLGLSISRQIVDAHRGRIWAENRTDATGGVIGARFLIPLPAAP